MSSPFDVFRKHQRVLIAVTGVLCMVAFIFIPVITDLMDTRADVNPVVATTKYGDVHSTDLALMKRSRRLANQFVINAMMQANPGQIRQVRTIFGPNDDESVVHTMLLARRADEMGLQVSDRAINQFLRELTENRVTSDQLRIITQGLQSSTREIFAALRTEMKAVHYRNLLFGQSNAALPGSLLATSAPPGLRWDYYRRIHAKAIVEFLPVPVMDFVDQVDNPSEAEVEEFYLAHKDTYSSATSPEPGFRQPQRAAFAYVKADFDQFFDPSAVSDEAILEEYEANKDTLYLYSGLDEDPVTDEVESGGEEAGGGDAGTATEETEGENGEPAQDEAPVEEESANEEVESAEDTAADEASGEANNDESDDDVTTGEDATDNGESSDAEGAGDELSGDVGTGEMFAVASSLAYVQAVAALGGQEGEADNVDPEVAGNEDEAATHESAAAETGSGSVTTSGPVPATTPIADEADRIPDLVSMPGDITEGEKPKYDPLWKVEEAIREKLAREMADETIRKALDPIKSEMIAFARRRVEWNVDHPNEPFGETLDFAALASETAGLSAHETALLSAVELEAETDIGKSDVDRNESFVSRAMGGLRPYVVVNSADLDQNRYAFWKTAEEEDRVPALDEIRDQVVLAWKVTRARDLAIAAAREKAAEVNESGSTLSDAFGEAVFEEGPFSWITSMFFQDAELTDIAGVEAEGDALMGEIFSLDVGEAGAAFNGPMSIAYCVRVVSLEPAADELRQNFLTDRYTSIVSVALREQQEIYVDWMKQLEQQAGLDWVEEPQTFRR